MCLSVPGRVTEIFEEEGLRMGKVAFGGVAKSVCLEHVPEATVGDYVLVHVGFALARIDADEAKRVFDFLATLEPAEEDVAQ